MNVVAGRRGSGLRRAAHRADARPVAKIAPWLLLGSFATLFWLERRRPLRRRVADQDQRLVANVLVGAGGALVVATIEEPVVRALAAAVERRRFGIAPLLGLRPAGERVAALLLLDYTLYLWHVLLHRAPALWRWHRVHHADADLDVSTALRFHAIEMLWSLPWRIAQVVLIGAGPATVDAWRRLTFAAVMFHHANLRLSADVERRLGAVVVTPRLHGIHHSAVLAHQHGNYSSGLAIWDRLHGTVQTDVPQETITIGLPAGDAERS